MLFDHLKESHERALDPLAGGIIQQGYQCGMLWGASMAAGAEAYRRCRDFDKAVALAIIATQHLTDSFLKRTKSMDCYDITQCDWTSKKSITKHMITGKVFSCFWLLEKWAPEAVKAAYEGLDQNYDNLPPSCISCASKVAKRMGATDEEAVMVAGFAGGIGLSGNACGALGAAIWVKTLEQCKKYPGKSFFSNPEARELLEKFYRLTNFEIQCSDICGRTFETSKDHTEFISNKGCKELIEELSLL
jgi:hypothetical protein